MKRELLVMYSESVKHINMTFKTMLYLQQQQHFIHFEK